MIKANELMIGNWVNLEFVGPFQWEYTHFEDYVKDSAHGWDVEGCIISDKVEPIPLTPEILEKCGFARVEKYSNNFHVYPNWSCNDNSIYVFKGTVQIADKNLHATWIINCEHLHHLQNIWFALAGEELTVTL